ncbi:MULTISPECIES: tRNA (cytidine(34)-2'-O)-methyltransferase [unclassified Brucella]|uniref:tRNA (cytidine(34)-2'-O)-methyltransferase n=1 Tax=unclassified Brucella TaxID=2632610 RepID=UPI00129760BA|nr:MULTISPECIES: tRNA (cytidine(34)-2'-O)-methyltransferase [unclassified Brucella]QGA57674.1 tRNA methyltransferase [Brucella sp. 2280]CAB4327725.1 ribosomal RNA methyltransferase [Brucella sp. 191011898]
MELRVALYQPDIPGNTGTILRMAACLGFAVDLIEPAGFDISDRALKRAGMDYLEQAALTRHPDWHCFDAWRKNAGRRLVLLSTKAAIPYTGYQFQENDILLFGRESAGVPEAIHDNADERLLIPMVRSARSLNLAVSVAMTTGEALRQIRSKIDSHPGK